MFAINSPCFKMCPEQNAIQVTTQYQMYSFAEVKDASNNAMQRESRQGISHVGNLHSSRESASACMMIVLLKPWL